MLAKKTQQFLLLFLSYIFSHPPSLSPHLHLLFKHSLSSQSLCYELLYFLHHHHYQQHPCHHTFITIMMVTSRLLPAHFHSLPLDYLYLVNCPVDMLSLCISFLLDFTCYCFQPPYIPLDFLFLRLQFLVNNK